MFDDEEKGRAEEAREPGERAREKADEFRMHAQLAAVFEGCRKFDAELRVGLSAEVARQVQRGIGKLEKAKDAEHPVLPENVWGEAKEVLVMGEGLSTNDYHVYRRPGEVMVARWIAGEEVDRFYERLQAHFDVAMNHFREEQKQANAWKQDPGTLAYLEALEKIEVKMEERYLRGVIREHGVFVLSTQAIDEIDILYLCDYLMGVDVARLVGEGSAPPEEGATEGDRAWFFKLYSLRGMVEKVERMCFFTYMQKAGEGW